MVADSDTSGGQPADSETALRSHSDEEGRERERERERERARDGNISDAIDSWEWQTGAGWVRRSHMGQKRDMYSRLKVTERENKLEMAQKQDKAE